ncbi:MAG: hypothetical protein F6J97_18190 [Leptolyngbya sp. SIO4C1]|nr:hypothetical protein [Leptolyngbya sp. SIO4C1]
MLQPLTFWGCALVTGLKKNRWLDFTEYALLLSTGAGTAASLATQQLIFASAPLSLLAAIGLVNRQRLEQRLNQARSAHQSRTHKLAQALDALQQDVAERPTSAMLSQLQQSIALQSEQTTARFSQLLERTQRQIEQQIDEIDLPDLSVIYQDVVQLQDQYTYLCASANSTNAQLKKLSNRTRLDSTEAEITQVKTETMRLKVALETFRRETKNSHTGLSDQLQHFERRLRQLPLQSDPQILKEEVHELIRSVAKLVPRSEFLELLDRVQALREQHRQLWQLVERRTSPDASVDQTVSTLDQTAAQIADELTQLAQALPAEAQAAGQSTAVEATLQQAAASYLSSLQTQFARLQQLTQTFETQHQQLTQQLANLPDVLDAVAMQKRMEQLQRRLDGMDERLGQLGQSVEGRASQPHATLPAGEARWLFDLPAAAIAAQGSASLKSSSRKILEQALRQAQKRLLLVWPWADDMALDEALIEQFRRLLERRCHLEIGWCHTAPADRLLRSIYTSWGEDSPRQQQLKAALRQLLPLKQAYPEQFRFKVLGTPENFLVCDRAFAVLGMQPLPTRSSLFPELPLRLQTTYADAIEALIQRFDSPTIAPDNVVALFNRGMTRYDLRDQPGAIADFTQVLGLEATAAAYNHRAVAWAELNEPQKALYDLTQAIQFDPQQWTVYCNRGVLRLQQADYTAAIADLIEATRLNRQTVIPYFYRAQALQALGDWSGAVADFSRVIQACPQLAFPYCYRAAAYQKLGQTQQAIADLKAAANRLKAAGDLKRFGQVVTTLQKLLPLPERAIA